MEPSPTVSVHSALVRLLATMAVVLGIVLGWSPVAHAGTPVQLESCFLSAINAARADAGVGALSRDGTLSEYGRAHSMQMADSAGLYHSSGAALEPYLPIDWRAWGENVGKASDDSDCGPLFQGFMDSNGHRANLLDPAFDIAGIGVIIDGDGSMWTTHVFVDVAAADSGTTTTTSSTTTTSTSTSTSTVAPVTTTNTTPTDTTLTQDGSTTTSGSGAAETSTTAGSAASTTQHGATTTSSSIQTADTPVAPTAPSADATDTSSGSSSPPTRTPEPQDQATTASGVGGCAGPMCNDVLTVFGLLSIAGLLGGVLVYWALRT